MNKRPYQVGEPIDKNLWGELLPEEGMSYLHIIICHDQQY